MAADCSKIKILMHEAIDDDLDVKERYYFNRHLAVCARCRREYEVLAGAVGALAAAPRLEPSPTFVADVMRRGRLAKARQGRRRLALSWVAAAAAAAAGAGAVAFWGVFLKGAVSLAFGRVAGDLATTAAGSWKVAKALGFQADALGKVFSALGRAGSALAWEGVRASSPIYLGAFVAIGLFYLAWRAGSRAAAPLVQVI